MNQFLGLTFPSFLYPTYTRRARPFFFSSFFFLSKTVFGEDKEQQLKSGEAWKELGAIYVLVTRFISE